MPRHPRKVMTESKRSRSQRGHKPHRLSDTRSHCYLHQAIQRLSVKTQQTPAFAADLSSDQRVGGSTSLSAPIIADVKHCHSAFEVNQTCNSGRLAQINLWLKIRPMIVSYFHWTIYKHRVVSRHLIYHPRREILVKS